MSLNITTQQIKDHRAARKAAGLAGCISGRPEPPLDFFGYKDVQSWRPIDPMKPYCFCFDCRDLWDNDATIDLQLLEDGHTVALMTYSELLPPEFVHPKHVALPQRSNGGGISMPPLCIDTSVPKYGSFDEIPSSLPAPKHFDGSLKAQLAKLRGEIQAELVVVMDSRRGLSNHDDAYDRVLAEATIHAKEAALWSKLDAIDILMKD